jgi:hypothetical protein
VFGQANNVEQIVWESILERGAEVRVEAHSVTSVKGQEFALAWKVFREASHRVDGAEALDLGRD